MASPSMKFMLLAAIVAASCARSPTDHVGASRAAAPRATTPTTNPAVIARHGAAALLHAPTEDRATQGDPLAALRAQLSRPGAIAWTQAASLLGPGTVSCIDGRADAPVLGAPGGDAGELVLSLAALEEVLGRPLSAA